MSYYGNRRYNPPHDVYAASTLVGINTGKNASPSAPVNAVLHVPAHKQTRPSAAPAQIVDTEWHALARIAA